MEKYVVCCKSFDDIQEFYNDMETPGGNDYVPDRVVECTNRKALSRNTIYLLSEEEVEKIRQDPRVKLVVSYKELYIDRKVEPLGWSQYSDQWAKDSTTNFDANDKNWALLQNTYDGNNFLSSQPFNGWGSDSTTDLTANVYSMYSGYNVDIVIIDGHIDKNHPEFAVNSDGTGGTRVMDIDWNVFTNIVNGTQSDLPTSHGSYIYGDTSSFLDYGSDHGMHVAGTAAGNTQGWARGATIYNLSPYGSGSYGTANPNNAEYKDNEFDYIRAFHKNKPINPITGRRNPTIANASYGTSYTINSGIYDVSVTFRGNTVTTDVSANSYLEIVSWGIDNRTESDSTYVNYSPFTSAAIHSETTDLINDGVILVTSAGNGREFYAEPGDPDYDNKMTLLSIYDYYYCRGKDEAYANTGGIAVGNIHTHSYIIRNISSARGQGIHVHAPGTAIASAVHAIGDNGTGSKESDSRNSAYKLDSKSGTSMAGPQVAGVLACIAEEDWDLDQDKAKEWLQKNTKKNELMEYNNTADFSDLYWLGNTDQTTGYYGESFGRFGGGKGNRFLHLKQDGFRTWSGYYEKVRYGRSQFMSHGDRPTSGSVYPRTVNRQTPYRYISKWYPVYVGYASTSPAHFKITGIDANGTFKNRNSSTTSIAINVGEAISFSNFWGSGVIQTSHPIRISSSVGGAEHSDVTNNQQHSYTFIPQSTGTYYYYCTNHSSMSGQIIVS